MAHVCSSQIETELGMRSTKQIRFPSPCKRSIKLDVNSVIRESLAVPFERSLPDTIVGLLFDGNCSRVSRKHIQLLGEALSTVWPGQLEDSIN
jgi:hypothetical protein